MRHVTAGEAREETFASDGDFARTADGVVYFDPATASRRWGTVTGTTMSVTDLGGWEPFIYERTR